MNTPTDDTIAITGSHDDFKFLEFNWGAPVTLLRARFIITSILKEYHSREIIPPQSHIYEELLREISGPRIVVDELDRTEVDKSTMQAKRIRERLGFTFDGIDYALVTSWTGLCFGNTVTDEELAEMNCLFRQMRQKTIPKLFLKEEDSAFAEHPSATQR